MPPVLTSIGARARQNSAAVLPPWPSKTHHSEALGNGGGDDNDDDDDDDDDGARRRAARPPLGEAEGWAPGVGAR